MIHMSGKTFGSHAIWDIDIADGGATFIPLVNMTSEVALSAAVEGGV